MKAKNSLLILISDFKRENLTSKCNCLLNSWLTAAILEIILLLQRAEELWCLCSLMATKIHFLGFCKNLSYTKTCQILPLFFRNKKKISLTPLRILRKKTYSRNTVNTQNNKKRQTKEKERFYFVLQAASYRKELTSQTTQLESSQQQAYLSATVSAQKFKRE